MAATMNNYRTATFDDQMVPEISFDVVTLDGGATVFETPPSNDTPSKPLPDFDTLLDDFTNTVNDSGSSGVISSDTNALMDSNFDTLKSWELEAYNDISMYEDIPFQTLKPEKLQTVIKQEVVEQSPMLQALQSPVEEQLGFADNWEIDDLKTKITFACETLHIPSNPSCWTRDHSQRWVLWTLRSYSLPEFHADQFVMAGSTLCQLTQDDFRRKSPQSGEFLSTELDIWKTAHNLSISSEFGNQEESSLTAEFYQEEPPTFTDLDAISVLPQVSAPSHVVMHQPMKCIPTPVITCTSPYAATSPMTSSLNPSLADSPLYASGSSTGSSMSVSPAPSMESLSNSNSSGASWSCSMQNSPDMDDSSTEMPSHNSYQDVHTVPCVPHHGKHTIHLWQFLKELLLQPHAFQGCIRWLDRSKGIFKIEDSARVAKLWGGRKNRPAMNYDKLSRSIRQYYKKGIIKKTTNSKRLVYQFCPQYL